jgi:hypothetical protein
MSKDEYAFLVLFGTVMVLLVATSLLVGVGPRASSRNLAALPRDTAHWYGWVGAVILGISATYSALKRFSPRNVRLWLFVHCITGILSLLVTGMHLLNRFGRARPGQFLSFFMFGLMVVIVVVGIVGRYRVRVPIFGEYWRQLHLPLTALFYVLLALHLLQKMGLF